MKRFCFFALVFVVLYPLAVYAGGTRAGSNGSGNSVIFNSTGFPIVANPYTLRVIAAKHQSTKDYPNLPVFQKLEEKTGVHIEWEYAGVDWATQKPLVLASGDLPDVFYGRTVLMENDFIPNRDLFVQ
jgi:putative aldouronate transport system substrate-binding protein